MANYQEPEKKAAREAVIRAAIESLTTLRRYSTLVPTNYVRRVRKHLIERGTPSDKKVASTLSPNTISAWERFHKSLVRQRNASDLRIAYLAGPNPENDLEEFVRHGVLPENVWAFESDSGTYLQAVESALTSKFPFIKLLRVDIGKFFDASPQKFDVVYLDFTGPLPSRNKKQRTLATISSIFARHALNSPGILIVNTSLPTSQQDPQGATHIAKLVAAYLYPKDFLESPKGGGFTEGAFAHGHTFEEWLNLVSTDLPTFYGQYLTRVVMDQASVIVPCDRFPQEHTLLNQLFNLSDKDSLLKRINGMYHFTEDGNGGDVIVEMGSYPILWSFAALSNRRGNDENYPTLLSDDNDFQTFADLFVRQVGASGIAEQTIQNVETLQFLLSEGIGEEIFYSDKLSKLAGIGWVRSFYQFCDLVLFHQAKELLFGQLAIPYHVNVDRTRRWTYQAKETRMFMDMLIVDECRYAYDWMPTLDMLTSGLDDVERQLSYRFALDGVGKHRRWYNPEFFSGTAVIDQFSKGFEAKVLSARVTIS